MTASEGPEEQIEAAGALLMSGADVSAEPSTWHGGLSIATLILMPFGISATEFIKAPSAVRDLALDHLRNMERQRVIRSLTLSLVVGLGFAMFLNPTWRLVACGGVAIKAGIDLGRFNARRKTLASAHALGEQDLELIEPEAHGD